MLIDRGTVIDDLETQIRWIEDFENHKFPGWYNVVTVMRDAMELLQSNEQPEPEYPVRVCQSGRLLVGSCPLCGQIHLNNEDNNFCGKCGHPIKWKYIVDPEKF